MHFHRHLLAAVAFGVAAVAAAPLFVAGPVDACLHPPVEIAYPLKPGTQLALVFFADGRQEMVIRPSYKLELPETGPNAPKDDAHGRLTTLAWVVPVPNVPDSYKEVDASMFTKLREFTPIDMISPLNSDSPRENRARHSPDQKGVTMLEAVSVGDYTIQPIKAKGELGGLELNAWLKDKGFGEIAAPTLKYYLEKDYCWLAVRIHNAKGLPANGEVKPLQIGFATEKPVFPLKIHAGGNSFDLELWLITGKEIDTEKSKEYGLKTAGQISDLQTQRNQQTTFAELPEKVRAVANDVAGLKSLKTGNVHCVRFFGNGLNKATDLAKLETDLTFEFKPQPESK